LGRVIYLCIRKSQHKAKKWLKLKFRLIAIRITSLQFKLSRARINTQDNKKSKSKWFWQFNIFFFICLSLAKMSRPHSRKGCLTRLETSTRPLGWLCLWKSFQMQGTKYFKSFLWWNYTTRFESCHIYQIKVKVRNTLKLLMMKLY
jgi:hypothetical protein